MRRPIYILFYDSWYWKLVGFVGVILFISIACVVLYFPVIKPNVEAQKLVVSRIEQMDIDYSYGDISEFSTHSNAYSQAQKYDGKIVSFTGCVSTIRGSMSGEYGESIISIHSEVSNEWCVDCGVNSISEADLGQRFKEGDKVTVVGEVYRSDWVIVLRNCKVELCNN